MELLQRKQRGNGLLKKRLSRSVFPLCLVFLFVRRRQKNEAVSQIYLCALRQNVARDDSLFKSSFSL